MHSTEPCFSKLALSDEQYARVMRRAKRRAGMVLAAGGIVSLAGMGTALAGLMKAEARAIAGVVETSEADYSHASQMLTDDGVVEIMVYAGSAAAVGGIALIGVALELEAHSADRQARRMVQNVQPTDIILTESRN